MEVTTYNVINTIKGDNAQIPFLLLILYHNCGGSRI